MAQVQRGDQALRHTPRSIHPCAHILLVTFVCVPPASPPSAYYHCLITATTIGYGDVPISTNGGKWFASLHMMVSVSLVAELLASIQKIRADRTVLLRRAHMLMLRLDDTLLQRMQQRALELRPLVKREEGTGVNELEFAIGMLVELEMVTTDQIRPFLTQFRALDVSANGMLNQEDWVMTQKLSPNDLRTLQRQNTDNYNRNGINLVGALSRIHPMNRDPHPAAEAMPEVEPSMSRSTLS